MPTTVRTRLLGDLRRDDRVFKDLRRCWFDVSNALQTRPERRERGVASELMDAVVEYAAQSGLEQLRLVLRGGEGLEDFYGHRGWTEIGRHHAALRLAENEDPTK
jgi:GNAT superfamily N-acetyltransferase